MSQSDDPLKEIRRAATGLLARREHSETEIYRKLQKKGFTEESIQQVISALTQEKLLSNARFIENYVYYRRSKGLGPLRIQAELMEKLGADVNKKAQEMAAKMFKDSQMVDGADSDSSHK